MYLRILKKDLKRKKTMNCIILLFVILSVMFFSSGMNNIISVLGGLDRYFDMAGAKDHVACLLETDGSEPFKELLEETDGVKSYGKEEILFFSSDQEITVKGKDTISYNQFFLTAPDRMYINCFDKNNERITDVEKGKVLVTSYGMNKMHAKPGDIVMIDIEGEKTEFEIAGICKDAVLGSQLVMTPRFIINSSDFDRLMDNSSISSAHRGAIYHIEADDDTIAGLFAKYPNTLFHSAKSLIRASYMLDIMTAAIVMVVSLFLIVISLVMLRFTIGFTITEEFREIGVMKAIGFKNSSIRMLYLVKYFGIAITGAAIGFFAAIPFGDLLMDSASQSMVFTNDHPISIGLICSAAMTALIILFCRSCTAKIKKLSPIDAVRSGQTGERFNKHSSMKLGKSRLGTSGFISLNDVISSPKQTAILVIVFTLCAALVMAISNIAETMRSEQLLPLMPVTTSDLYMRLPDYNKDIQKGNKTISEVNAEIEKKLADNGMPADVYSEAIYNSSLMFGGKTLSIRAGKCEETTMEEYRYVKGTPLQGTDEIAVSSSIALELGADIGEKLTLTINGEEKEILIAEIFDCMNNAGMFARLHPEFDVPDSAIAFLMSFQVNFDDRPDSKTIEERKEKLTEIFETDSVYNATEYVDKEVGAASGMESAKYLSLAVSLIIIALMSILLERSFISKERSEIALMKAIGFKSRSVVGIHILRFAMISVVSVSIAAALSFPATKLVLSPICAALGALNSTCCAINKTDTFFILPAIIVATVVMSAFITALYTGSIKASDTSNIE